MREVSGGRKEGRVGGGYLSGSRPRSSASLKTMKANSPPPARRSATRIASARVSPKAKAPSAKRSPSLAARNATMPDSSVGHSYRDREINGGRGGRGAKGSRREEAQG